MEQWMRWLDSKTKPTEMPTVGNTFLESVICQNWKQISVKDTRAHFAYSKHDASHFLIVLKCFRSAPGGSGTLWLYGSLLGFATAQPLYEPIESSRRHLFHPSQAIAHCETPKSV